MKTREKYAIGLRILIFIVSAVAGAAMNRWRGAGTKLKRFFPRPLPQITLSIPYGLVVLHHGGPWWLATLAFAGALAGFSTGHGQYFPDLAPKAIKPERVDVLVKPFFGKDPRTDHIGHLAPFLIEDYISGYGRRKLGYRCLFGMTLTGVMVSLVAGIATANIGVAISGALKGPVYVFANRLKLGTAGGEWFFGAAAWGSLAILTNL